MNILQYARTSPHCAPWRAGRPVWPVTSDDDLLSLRATATLFGARLEQVEPDRLSSAAAASESGGSLVMYPDPRLSELAGLYAHLTSRTAIQLPLAEVSRALPDLVVCLWEHLSLDLLGDIHRACLERPLGLLVAPTLGELRERLIRAAAAASLEPPERGAILAVHGSDAGPRARAHSGEPSGLGALLHQGHSDGLDLSFGPGEVLCDVRRQMVGGRSGAAALPCVQRGHCYRLDQPLSSALTGGRLLAPSDLRARAAVFLTCFGVSTSDALVPPSWSLLDGLLASPSLGCVATAFGVSLPDRTIIEALTRGLSEGHTIGQVLYQNSELPSGARERCRLLLFGDPRTRPLRPAPVVQGQVRPSPSRGQGNGNEPTGMPAVWTTGSRAGFLLDLVVFAGTRSPGLIDRLSRFAAEHSSNPPGDDAFARLLDGLAPLWDHWPALCGRPRHVLDTPLCPGCGRAGDSFRFDLSQAGSSRVLSTCARCGVFRDIEGDSALAALPPRICQGVVEIPDEVSDGWVMLKYRDQRKKSTYWALAPARERRQVIVPAPARVKAGAGLAILIVIYLRKFEMAGWQFALHVAESEEDNGAEN